MIQEIFTWACVVAIFAFLPVTVIACLIIDRKINRKPRKNLGLRPVHDRDSGVE